MALYYILSIIIKSHLQWSTQVEGMSRDPEFYGLLYGVQSQNIPGHNYRGYTILGEENGREAVVSTF